MKKSTVLIVLVTFALSVVIVGIFGMRMMSYNTRIYVETIVPTRVYLNTGDTVEIKPRETDTEYEVWINDYTEGLTLRMDYSLEPADATENDILAQITSKVDENDPVARLDGLTLHILRVNAGKSVTVRVNYRATDGGGANITVWFFIRNQQK